MKLHFEPNLDYQLQAIEAVCDLFRGQEICRTDFTVVHDPADKQLRMGFNSPKHLVVQRRIEMFAFCASRVTQPRCEGLLDLVMSLARRVFEHQKIAETFDKRTVGDPVEHPARD